MNEMIIADHLFVGWFFGNKSFGEPANCNEVRLEVVGR